MLETGNLNAEMFAGAEKCKTSWYISLISR